MTTAILTLIILILLNAFFAASEIALIGLNDAKIKKQADAGDKKAALLYRLISEPSRFLSTIQIGITLAGFLASAFAADFFAGPIASVLHGWGVPLSLAMLETLAVVATTILLSYFTLVFGELVPKQLALHRSEKISAFAAVPLTYLSRLTLPAVKLLTFSTNAVVRLFGVDPNAHTEEATEEEIRMLVDIGGERGTIQDSEKLMINNIFEFNDKTVSDIVTHRTAMSALPVDAGLEDILRLADEKRYTRFPVYEGDLDTVVGILHVKDLFRFIRDSRQPFHLKQVIREPHFVLETMRVDRLFAEMQKNNVHIAIVLDQYGGTEGLVTIEDVIEEIVGEIFSESPESGANETVIRTAGPGRYELDGTVRLWELEEAFHIKLPSDEFETVSGFLIDRLGRIPAPDERPTIVYKNLVFEVAEVGENRVEKVRLRLTGESD